MFYWVVDMLDLPSQINASEELAATCALFLLIFMVTSIADLVYKFFSSFWR